MATNKKYFFKGIELILVRSLWSEDHADELIDAIPATFENGIATVEVKNLSENVVLELEKGERVVAVMIHDASANLLYLRSRKETLSEIAELCKAQNRNYQLAYGLLITGFDTDIWFELKDRYKVKPEGLAAKPTKKETPIKPVAEGSGDAAGGPKPVKLNPSGVAAIAERLAQSGIKPAAKPVAEDSKKLSAKEFFKKS